MEFRMFSEDRAEIVNGHIGFTVIEDKDNPYEGTLICECGESSTLQPYAHAAELLENHRRVVAEQERRRGVAPAPLGMIVGSPAQ